jgi:hypothetical protein
MYKMRLEFQEIPPLMAIGFIEGQDYRILKICGDEITFESDEQIEDVDVLEVSIFNLTRSEYQAFRFTDCELLQLKQREFSCTYTLKVDIGQHEDFPYYSGILRQLAEFPQTASGPVQSRLGSLDFLRNTQMYDYEKDSDFHESYELQLAEWFGPASRTTIESGRHSRDDYELALAINNTRLYKQVAQYGYKALIQSELERLGLDKHWLVSQPLTRVYIGNDYCPHLCPDEEILCVLLAEALSAELDVTIVLPSLTEAQLEPVQRLLDNLNEWCSSAGKTVEVTVNDWSLFLLLEPYRQTITPVLGKLLNKIKKDPRTQLMFGYERHKEKMQENNVSAPHYSAFLNKWGITRFEFEAHGTSNRIPEGTHSLHFPYYQINTSAFCPLYAECVHFNIYKQKLVEHCPQFCGELCKLYPKHVNMIGRGNSVFGFDGTLLTEPDVLDQYVANGIDRLVFSVE